MSYKLIILIFFIISILIGCGDDTVTTPTVNIETVKIGNQVWTLKNLNVDLYMNGDSIRYAPSDAEWISAAYKGEGVWCYYNNDPAMGAVYGKLYNWYAVNDPRGLAPDGFHIPTNDEWTELSTFLGGEDVAGGKMKDTASNYWIGPNLGATNSSRFTALPGGFRTVYGNFYDLYRNASFWSATSSTEISLGTAWSRRLYYEFSDIRKNANIHVHGFSVRCIKD